MDSVELVSVSVRFWSKVKVQGPDDCWLWTGAKSSGYGILSSRRGCSPLKAHRVSYELHNGEIPDGLGVLHDCDNPPCVNPAHLFLGTQKVNCMDAARKGRLNPKSFLNLNPGKKGFYGAAPR